MTLGPCIATLKAAIRIIIRPSALHYALLGSVVANDNFDPLGAA